MGALVVYAAVFLIGVPVVAWAIRRDCRRAVARARARAKFRQIGKAFAGMQGALAAALVPAFGQAVKAAADMEREMTKFAATMQAGSALAQLAALADAARVTSHRDPKPEES